MSFGKNLKHLRRMCGEITQETLAEKLKVSRQTVSKWELDESLDNIFREEMGVCDDAYTDLRVETVPGFRYIAHAVISNSPEEDAIGRVLSIARENGVEHPKVIGWDFPYVSQEQINVYRMHGYVAAWILPEGVTPEGAEILEQKAHKYAAIHIPEPFKNPFAVIPNAYKTLTEYMRVNGLERTDKDVIPCFETDGDAMDVYIACGQGVEVRLSEIGKRRIEVCFRPLSSIFYPLPSIFLLDISPSVW